MQKSAEQSLLHNIAELSKNTLAPLDLLAHSDLREKCIDLVLNGIPGNIDQKTVVHFHELRQHLTESRVDKAKVVVFGGGSGLSNIIGGDSRLTGWDDTPFTGLKEIFPRTQSVVCVTDDGGSTGELIKDLPVIALGDIRHVLLSSVQLRLLQTHYGVSYLEANNIASALYEIINFRFRENEITQEKIVSTYARHASIFPKKLHSYLSSLILLLFEDERFERTLNRSHCLGNLLLAAAIYSHIDPSFTNESLEQHGDVMSDAIFSGLNDFSKVICAYESGVLPCTATPAQLRVCYSNGVEATGECKSGSAVRGFPVERVVVDFSDTVIVHQQIFESIENADIIILAPGSLYSSIIPIFQVPGIAEAVRKNTHALKLLVSNLWVQAGETDIVISDPERKYHVSDMIRAYEQNIPGGTAGLFREVLCLSLKDVPASILQNYAIEGKIPIYLDKNIVRSQGFIPIECGIYSKKAISEIGVIKHDPELLARAVKTIFISNQLDAVDLNNHISPQPSTSEDAVVSQSKIASYPSKKYRQLEAIIHNLSIHFQNSNGVSYIEDDMRKRILEIIWKHQDIPLSHLNYIKGIVCIEKSQWRREQIWDKVFSFYDPEDQCIKIRLDQIDDPRNLEIAFLIALGQSLLGNYAEQKYVKEVDEDGLTLGKVYHLHIQKAENMSCHFTLDELDQYLHFARMYQPVLAGRHYTRLISGKDGFTPPGVLMGLTYAWYLDNRLASHIEYKMSLMKISRSDLIPEQLKMLSRRNALIQFFREVVFSS